MRSIAFLLLVSNIAFADCVTHNPIGYTRSPTEPYTIVCDGIAEYRESSSDEWISIPIVSTWTSTPGATYVSEPAVGWLTDFGGIYTRPAGYFLNAGSLSIVGVGINYQSPNRSYDEGFGRTRLGHGLGEFRQGWGMSYLSAIDPHNSMRPDGANTITAFGYEMNGIAIASQLMWVDTAFAPPYLPDYSSSNVFAVFRTGEFNQDNRLDLGDGPQMKINAGGVVSSVPEPSAFLLLGLLAVAKVGLDRIKHRTLDSQHGRLT